MLYELSLVDLLFIETDSLLIAGKSYAIKNSSFKTGNILLYSNFLLDISVEDFKFGESLEISFLSQNSNYSLLWMEYVNDLNFYKTIRGVSDLIVKFSSLISEKKVIYRIDKISRKKQGDFYKITLLLKRKKTNE